MPRTAAPGCTSSVTGTRRLRQRADIHHGQRHCRLPGLKVPESDSVRRTPPWHNKPPTPAKGEWRSGPAVGEATPAGARRRPRYRAPRHRHPARGAHRVHRAQGGAPMSTQKPGSAAPTRASARRPCWSTRVRQLGGQPARSAAAQIAPLCADGGRLCHAPNAAHSGSERVLSELSRHSA